MWSRDVTEARADRCRRRRRGRRRRGARRGGAAGARARVVGSGRRPPRRRGADGRPDPRPGGAQASQGARAQRRRRREGTRPHRAVATEARRGLHPAARGGRQAPALRGAREGRVHQLLGDLVPAVPRGDAGDGAPLAAAEGPGPRARRRVGRHRHEEGQALPRRAQAHVPGGARPEDGPRERVRCARGAVELRRGPSGPPHRDRAGAARVGQRRVPLADRRAAAVAMSESLGVAVAFSSGLFSFLSPCVLPLFPSCLSFITGMSVADLAADLSGAVRWRILGHALAFVVGFSIVFVALGASFSAASQFLLDYREWIRLGGGVLIVVFGLYIVGVFAWLARQRPMVALTLGLAVAALLEATLDGRAVLLLVGLAVAAVASEWLGRTGQVQLHEKPAGYLGSLAGRVTFAIRLTPCVGPILGGILSLAATTENVSRGVTLLVAYSAGLGVPFLLAAAALGPFLRFFRRYRPLIPVVERAAGLILVVVGVLVFTNYYVILNAWAISLTPDWLLKRL